LRPCDLQSLKVDIVKKMIFVDNYIMPKVTKTMANVCALDLFSTVAPNRLRYFFIGDAVLRVKQ
jgi:hypothetical protein